MNYKYIWVAVVLAVFLCASAPRAESILGALDAIGEEANRLNDSFLDSLSGKGGFEEQMASYRRREANRVREFAQASGVSPDVIRNMRLEGATWERIAAKYNVDLNSLPNPAAEPAN